MKNTILIFSLLFGTPMGFAQNISQNDVKSVGKDVEHFIYN
jgi:hypothetical protein